MLLLLACFIFSAPEIQSVVLTGDYSEPGNDITITVTIGEVCERIL